MSDDDEELREYSDNASEYDPNDSDENDDDDEDEDEEEEEEVKEDSKTGITN